MKVQRPLVTHAFKGKRFDDNGLDLDVLPDLFAYKELLVRTAKELWRRNHPDRERLPRNFEDSLCLKFFELQKGSVVVPIVRELETNDQPRSWQVDQPDELDQAVALVADAICAVDAGQALPENLPKNLIPLFDAYGKTLREDESFEIEPFGGQRKATYTRKSRERFLSLSDAGYNDLVDLTGEVRAVDLGGSFTIRLDDGARVPAKFSPEQEDRVTEALKEHATCRLRVKGTAEFNPDGKIKGINTVENLEIRPLGEVPFDQNARPIWEVIEEIGAAVPVAEWDKVPTDGAKNLDHYLYGHAKIT